MSADNTDSIVANDKSISDSGSAEPEEDCGLCLFMKGGGCKDAFVAWEDCIKSDDGKSAEKCNQVASLLIECMQDNAEYYRPVLAAQRKVDTVEVVNGDEMAVEEEEAQPLESGDSSGN